MLNPFIPFLQIFIEDIRSTVTFIFILLVRTNKIMRRKIG